MALIKQCQKRKAMGLQARGTGYRKIASELDISVNTAKYLCKMSDAKIEVSACKNCGKDAVSYSCFKKKKFCSDECRREWWSKNPEAINRKMKTYICKNCGKEFLSYRKEAVYCSRQCSGYAKRKGVAK